MSQYPKALLQTLNDRSPGVPGSDVEEFRHIGGVIDNLQRFTMMIGAIN